MGYGRVSTFARSAYELSLNWLFPPRCAGCGRLGEVWCRDCRSRVELIHEPYCDKCGSPNPGRTCLHCATWDYHFDAARAWGRYSGVLRTAILSFKKRHNARLGIELTAGMATVLESQPWTVDVLVPIPLAPYRLAERGYNQAELLAQPLAAASGIHYAPEILIRCHETVKQFELHAAQRWENLLGAFQADLTGLSGADVTLVDDIMTTGATLNAAALALKKAGAQHVYALTLAKTLFEEESFAQSPNPA